MEKIFEKATKQRIRFESAKGLISTEDVWELPLQANRGKMDLNSLAKKYHRLLKEEEEIDFVNVRTIDPVRADNQLRFDIIKYIIGVKKANQERAQKAAYTRQEKQKLLEILQAKKDSALQDLSVEELEKRIADL